jgi:AcrR family transcriptional regulator
VPRTVATTRKPTQARAIRTRARILAAGEREFSERGYAKTTATSIARRARVATGSVYQYFGNKDAILLELARGRVSRLSEDTMVLLENTLPHPEADVASVVKEVLRNVVTLVMQLHRDDPGLHAVLTERRHADPQLDREWTAAESDLITRIANRLSAWGNPGDATATAFVLFGMIEGAVHAHVLGHPMVSDERLTQALVDALMRVALPGL